MNPRDELKKTLTGWWEYMTVRAACQLNLFDLIDSGLTSHHALAERIPARADILQTLLIALKVNGYLMESNGEWELSEKGKVLTATHPESMKQAAILWGGEHINAWQGLAETIKTGAPAFEKLVGLRFFDYLAGQPDKLTNYHQAMDEYAREDYKELGQLFDFSRHTTLMDVGGGTGALLRSLQERFSESAFVLFDRPEVIKMVEGTSAFRTFAGNFFESIPAVADGIFLARVLHDWDDKHALTILANCYNALPEKGTLYLLENHADRLDDRAALLSLNMAVMCQSLERTSIQYRKLLELAGFLFEAELQINALQWMIIAHK